MDALIQSAHVGLAQIDASGTLTALNAEFARLFGIRVKDAVNRSVLELPSAVNDSWRQLVLSTRESSGLSRWNVVVGDPPIVARWTSWDGRPRPSMKARSSTFSSARRHQIGIPKR